MKRNKIIRDGEYRRTIRLDRLAADDETRTVPASLSSEAEFERWFGREILVHETDAVDLTRAGSNGLPLLWNHSQKDIIGRVRDVHLDGDRLRGTLHFARNPAASQIWDDVCDGMLTDMSVGYRINKWEETDDSDIVRVTRWQPYEASVVAIPADHTVGINRSHNAKGPIMPDNDGQSTEGTGGNETVDITALKRHERVIGQDAERRARTAERARISAIDDAFQLQSVPRTPFFQALRMRAIDEGWSESKTNKTILEAMADDTPPDLSTVEDPGTDRTARRHADAPGADHRGGIARASVTEDERDKLAGIVEKTMLVRGGIEQDVKLQREVRESGMHDYSAFDLGAEILRSAGVNVKGRSKRDIAGIMLGRAGSHSNADFPSILANVATKAAMRGWFETPTTWRLWCNTGSLPDFKQATIAGLGGYPDLDLIPRSGGPYNEHSMDDIHEVAQLATYGGLFSIGRETLINDDLNAFTRTPMKMGAAAARKVNGLAYAQLTGNPTLTQDSTALFDATHSNYVTSGAAPSTTTLDAGFTAMAKQTPPTRSGETSTAYLNLSPQYLLVPKALDTTSRVLATSTYDPAGTTASIAKRDAPNPFQGRIEVISDALLDASNASGWYLAAPRNGPVDTVSVFFLNGMEEPFIEQQDQNPTSDGVVYKVRMDAVAAALDFRGLYYNDGVT